MTQINLIKTSGKRYFNTALNDWIWIVIFSIAFAWVEERCCCISPNYLLRWRIQFSLAIHWENGKHVIDPLIRIEFGREIATVIILWQWGTLPEEIDFKNSAFL